MAYKIEVINYLAKIGLAKQMSLIAHVLRIMTN
jgi:hypothetical protein